jgi:hypothetical protein
MNDRNGRSFMKRQIKYQKKLGPTESSGLGAEWEHKDAQLDDALRQNFPASDALSIVQSGRGN